MAVGGWGCKSGAAVGAAEGLGTKGLGNVGDGAMVGRGGGARCPPIGNGNGNGNGNGGGFPLPASPPGAFQRAGLKGGKPMGGGGGGGAPSKGGGIRNAVDGVGGTGDGWKGLDGSYSWSAMGTSGKMNAKDRHVGGVRGRESVCEWNGRGVGEMEGREGRGEWVGEKNEKRKVSGSPGWDECGGVEREEKGRGI